MPAARPRQTGAQRRQRHTHANTRHAARGKTGTRRWSQRVTDTSDALDLERDIFKTGSAQEIAASLKRSAERSRRRKASPLQSAMSMLNFYANRAGRKLPAERRRVLERAKGELRTLYGRDPRTGRAPRKTAAKTATSA